jgi:hypothetical protein
LSYYLRKISRNKWDCNMDRQPGNYSADAITGCTRTSSNTLSVWESEVDDYQSEEAERIIVALASEMQKPDTIDLIWLNPEWLRSKAIDIQETPGKSKFPEVNSKHRDLSDLDHEKLATIASHIVSQLKKENNHKKITRRNLINIVKKWIDKDTSIVKSEFTEAWQNEFQK